MEEYINNLPGDNTLLIYREISYISDLLRCMGLIERNASKEMVPLEWNFHNLNIEDDTNIKSQEYFTFGEKCLRSHTTASHTELAIYNEKHASFWCGKAFRNDKGKNYKKEFYQLELLIPDYDIYELENFILCFLGRYFKSVDLELKTRPYSFLFTLPSFEIDAHVDRGVYELLGAGIMRKEVTGGIEKIGACGMGIERLVMIKYGLSDINSVYDKYEKYV